MNPTMPVLLVATKTSARPSTSETVTDEGDDSASEQCGFDKGTRYARLNVLEVVGTNATTWDRQSKEKMAMTFMLFRSLRLLRVLYVD